MLTSDSRFSYPPFLLFFFAAHHTRILRSRFVAYFVLSLQCLHVSSYDRCLISRVVSTPCWAILSALISFISCFLAKFLDGIYTCWFIGSGQWESVSVMAWLTVSPIMVYFSAFATLYTRIFWVLTLIILIAIIIIRSWGRPFYAFFCACCTDSFLQTWIFLWSY